MFGIILSLVYDGIWFFLRYADMNADDDGDGQMEKTIRKFSLTMAIISNVIKIIMCFVYWMTSIKFDDLIR